MTRTLKSLLQLEHKSPRWFADGCEINVQQKVAIRYHITSVWAFLSRLMHTLLKFFNLYSIAVEQIHLNLKVSISRNSLKSFQKVHCWSLKHVLPAKRFHVLEILFNQFFDFDSMIANHSNPDVSLRHMRVMRLSLIELNLIFISLFRLIKLWNWGNRTLCVRGGKKLVCFISWNFVSINFFRPLIKAQQWRTKLFFSLKQAAGSGS